VKTGLLKKRVVTAVLIIILAVSVPALQGCKSRKEEKKSSTAAETTRGFLVSTEELAALLKRPDVVIVDARPAEDYGKLHIPGAVNISRDMVRNPDDLQEILDYKRKHGFAVPPETAGRIFGGAGIGPDTRVIVYDSIKFPHASIIWAMLKYFGHDNVQVLKGGFERWAAEGRPLTAKPPPVRKKTFRASPRPEMVATRKWLFDNREKLVLLDMRSFEEYLGINPAGNPRGGHIPGAISLQWSSLAGDDTVKDPGEMRGILREAGVTPDKEIVTYCNIGIGRSTYGFMVLRMLGYDNVRVYGGSFEDWSADTGLAVETTKKGSVEDWEVEE